MEPGTNCIQSICLKNFSKKEEKFIHSYLEWRDFQVIKAHSSAGLADLMKNVDREKDRFCLVWNQVEESRIQELLDDELEILILGKLSKDEKKSLVSMGVARLFDDLTNLHQLPLEFSKPNDKSLLFWIFTGEKWMDKLLTTLLRSRGHITINPIESSHLFFQLPQEKPDVVILDWDHFLEKDINFFQKLEKYSQSYPLPFFLGIKDFQKQGLSHDLMKWVSRYSFTNFPRERILSVLIFSLPPYNFERNDKLSQPFSHREVNSIVWRDPSRGKLRESAFEILPKPLHPFRVPDPLLNWVWFDWLREESLF